MRSAISLAAAGVVAAVATAAAAEERLLFDNAGYDAFIPENFYCDQPVRMTVRASDPTLFEQDSPELQRIVDSAQAVLAFECPTVSGVELEGRLAGLPDPVYFAVAGPESDWELTVKQSIQSQEYEAYQPPVDGEYQSAEDAEHFTVANLSAGMGVEEARSTVAETFGVEPEYQVDNGTMTMRTGGCPADYDWAALTPSPEPGWKCLKAWFTDQRQPRLYLLDLVQVLEREDPEAVEQYLVDRFGETVHQNMAEQDRARWQKTQTIRTLAWGDVVETADAGDGKTTEVYNLQAKILPIDDVTVVTVTLYVPELRPQWASDPGSRIPDLTL